MGSGYKTLNSLMRHIRASTGMQIGGSRDKSVLARVGYFHGYKGYRYSGKPTRRIPYSDFAELQAVLEFDAKLKASFYPVLMRLERTMKNLALTVVLDAAASSSLPEVYAKLMPGTKHDGRLGKLAVIHSSNDALLKAYKRHNPIVRHYYDSAVGAVPIWALLEVITLGHFAALLAQLSDSVLSNVAQAWGMQRRDGGLVPRLVYAVTDLRNAVAHDGTVFDTRFKTGKVAGDVSKHLAREIGYRNSSDVDFRTITDYMVLATYLAVRLGFAKNEVKAFIRQYVAHTDELHSRVPVRVFDMIVHTNNRAKIEQLERWVRSL